MEKNKVDHGEPKFTEVLNKFHNIVGGIKFEILDWLIMVKGEKLNSSVIEWIKAENLMSFKDSQSPLTQLKLALLAATTMLLLGAFLLEFSTLSDTIRLRILTVILMKTFLVHQKNNGYLMVSSNGGLNQMRAGISDMVAIARYLNLTFIVPELDNTSFSNDRSHFEDIVDVDYFIQSSRDEVQILKQLPSKLKNRVKTRYLYSMTPAS